MKYVFVGDIHGKPEQVEEALQRDGRIVFVGDFMDSFDRSVENQVRALMLALDAVDAGKAVAIFGNHELSYLMPPQHRCSGYTAAADAHLIHLRERMFKTMVPFLRLPGDFLISHAGVMPGMLPHMTEQDFANAESPIHHIGWSRGGFAAMPGPFWCDFNREFVPTVGLNQVFGHTARGGKNGIRRLDEQSHNYCVDCLDFKTEFLELEL